MATTKRNQRAASDPVPQMSGDFQLPSAGDLAAAKIAREAAEARKSDAQPGRVRGLDYSKWAAAIVDLSELRDKPQRVAGHRARLIEKGYVLLQGEPVVDGFEEAEVWVKDRAQYVQDRLARRDKIRRHIAAGSMSDTALLTAEINGPYGRSNA